MKGIAGSIFALAALAAALTLAAASPAAAAVPPSLSDPANCEAIEPAPGLLAHRCDDGVPSVGGGLVPNPGGESAITVPAKYEGHSGLPAKAADAAAMPGADGDGMIALDVNVTLPGTAPPPGGYPLLFMMHGCCGGNKTSNEHTTVDAPGEAWHYSNAWFAARGYVVVTYTSRGFVNDMNQGSSGQTQLQSRSFEINDYQHLACQLLAAAPGFGAVSGHDVAIDPRRVVATGGSYGGGFSWLAFTDPEWTCAADSGAAGAEMQLAAAAPKYGWTDLAYTLVPTGLHSQLPGSLPDTSGCDTGPRTLDGDPCPAPAPVGVPKSSIVAGLFVTGTLPAVNHTTFTPQIAQGMACLTALYPFDLNPACGDVETELLPEFLRERSAYYQNGFFARVASDPGFRVPVFNAAAFTDPLFPAYEHRRMINRLLALDPAYPVTTRYGDYQHFVQNKAKEWGDICDTGDGRGRRVCEAADYPGGDFDAEPDGLVRTGITTELNRFIDHYARPGANRDEPEPEFEVTATLQVCPPTAGPDQPADEPGRAFTGRTLEQLAPNELAIEFEGAQRTTWKAAPNPHALSADPIVNERTNARACPVEEDDPGPGVASYESEPLPRRATMLGAGRARVEFSLTGPSEGLQLNARLYAVRDGLAVMADRGTRRIAAAEAAAGEAVLRLHGNGWRFERGDRVRIELAQDDAPYVRFTDVPSSLELSRVRLELPIRERSRELGPPTDPGPGPGDGPRGGDPRGNGSGGGNDGPAGGGASEPHGTPAAAAESLPGGTGPSGTAGGGGALPFTGLGLSTLLLVCAGLLAAGALARRSRRRGT